MSIGYGWAAQFQLNSTQHTITLSSHPHVPPAWNEFYSLPRAQNLIDFYLQLDYVSRKYEVGSEIVLIVLIYHFH